MTGRAAQDAAPCAAQPYRASPRLRDALREQHCRMLGEASRFKELLDLVSLDTPPAAVAQGEQQPATQESTLPDQTILHAEGECGNCLQATVAGILGWPLESVPHFALLGEVHWWDCLQSWLDSQGFWIDYKPGSYANEGGELLPRCWLSGQSPRGFSHAVVGDSATGAMLHDPHPSRAGLVQTDYTIYFFRKPRAAPADDVRDVLAEVARATRKFPTWPTDPLHAVAVLGEEFGELTKAMLQLTYEPHKTSVEEVRSEAIQTAAMSLRLVMSLDRYEYRRCEQHTQGAASQDEQEKRR